MYSYITDTLRDLLGARRKDSPSWPLHHALAKVAAEGKGVVVLLNSAEDSHNQKWSPRMNTNEYHACPRASTQGKQPSQAESKPTGSQTPSLPLRSEVRCWQWLFNDGGLVTGGVQALYLLAPMISFLKFFWGTCPVLASLRK